VPCLPDAWWAKACCASSACASTRHGCGPPRLSEDYARHPFALELVYDRKLEGAAIAERSIAEMRRVGSFTEEQARQWLELMKQAFPDVQAQDRLLGLNDGQGEVRFFHNGRQTAQLRDAEYARLFFGIWLSPQTSPLPCAARCWAWAERQRSTSWPRPAAAPSCPGAQGWPMARWPRRWPSSPAAVCEPALPLRQRGGRPLAGLGAVLLATRAFDALVDPAIGRWADRLLRRGVARRGAALASLLMALGFGRCGIRRATGRACWAGWPAACWCARWPIACSPSSTRPGARAGAVSPPGVRASRPGARAPAWRACCWPACCRPGWDWMRPQAFSPWAWHWA
jgi:hypothetical protein